MRFSSYISDPYTLQQAVIMSFFVEQDEMKSKKHCKEITGRFEEFERVLTHAWLFGDLQKRLSLLWKTFGRGLKRDPIIMCNKQTWEQNTKIWSHAYVTYVFTSLHMMNDTMSSARTKSEYDSVFFHIAHDKEHGFSLYSGKKNEWK